MWLTLLAVAVGLVAGIVSGGSVGTIGRARPHWASLALIWLALTAATRWVEVPGAKGLFLGANVAALMFCAVNIRRLGTALLFCGVALNTAVIALNGAMPYRVSSVISAGLATSASDFPQTVQTRPQLPGDLLTGLSDIIPVNAGLIHDVLSVGDIIAALGIAWVVYRSLQPTLEAEPTMFEASSFAPPSQLSASYASLRASAAAPAAPQPISVAQQRTNKLHVSKVRIGEEFDLLDDEWDNPAQDAEHNPPPGPLASSPISVVVDLTVDRLQHPHRHEAQNALDSSALMSHVLGLDGPDDVDVLDITDGEIPGSLFWAERTRILARSYGSNTPSAHADVATSESTTHHHTAATNAEANQ